MLSIPLVLALFAPQDAVVEKAPTRQAAPGVVATRRLPKKDTLTAIEFVGLKKLVEEAADHPMLRFWRHPKVDGFMRFASTHDPAWAAFYERRDEWLDMLARFDAGMAGALVFTKGRWTRPIPVSYFVGAASESERLRGYDADLEKLLMRSRAKLGLPDYEKRRLEVPDMPIALKVLETKTNQHNWMVRRGNFLVRRGRIAAFYGNYTHVQDEAAIAKTDAGIAEAMGSIVAGRARDRTMQMGAPMRLGDGEQILGRGIMRWAENVKEPEHGMRERTLNEMKAVGMLDWDGLTAALVKGPGGMREILDSHEASVEGDTPFAILRGDALGLGDASAMLPSNAMAAIRIAFDDAMLTRWASNLAEQFGGAGELDTVYRMLREALRLGDDAKGFEGVTELTLAVLPPAPGVLAPEACLLFRVAGDEKQPHNVMKTIAGLGGMAGAELQVKTLGKGDDAIPYVSVKDMFQQGRRGGMRMNEEVLVMKALLGGGFVSATRVGPYLAVGCNPRTIRKLKRSVAKGDTLAKREGFAEHFPAGSGKFLEAWIDWKSIAKSARVADQLVPLIFSFRQVSVRAVERAVAVADGGAVAPPVEKKQEPKKAPKLVFPTAADIAAIVGEQRITGFKTAYGHRIESEGSLVLSAMSIGAWAMAYDLYEKATYLMRN